MLHSGYIAPDMFQIPMRGSEDGALALGGQFPVQFQIPMRGSEADQGLLASGARRGFRSP